MFNSCTKSESEADINIQANNKFIAALNLTKKTINSTPLKSQLNVEKLNNFNERKLAPKEDGNVEMYVDFPEEINEETIEPFRNTKSIEDISNLMYKTDATLQYHPTSTNYNYQIDVPVNNEIEKSLNPLVGDAKKYLETKGFTESEIQDMLKEENAENMDLIPLVMVIVQSEKNQQTSYNYLNLFPINSLQARSLDWSDVGHCAAHAIGVDILFSLGTSAAVTWSKAAIKKAFKTVAKRALGPIGAAIAVADFGFCLGGIEI